MDFSAILFCYFVATGSTTCVRDPWEAIDALDKTMIQFCYSRDNGSTTCTRNTAQATPVIIEAYCERAYYDRAKWWSEISTETDHIRFRAESRAYDRKREANGTKAHQSKEQQSRAALQDNLSNGIISAKRELLSSTEQRFRSLCPREYQSERKICGGLSGGACTWSLKKRE